MPFESTLQSIVPTSRVKDEFDFGHLQQGHITAFGKTFSENANILHSNSFNNVK